MHKYILFTLSIISFSLFGQQSGTDLQIKKADDYFKKGDFNKALIIYKKAYETDSSNIDNIKRLGVNYYMLKEYDKAEKILSKVPEKSDVYIEYFLGVSNHYLGNYKKAIYHYKNCLDFSKNDTLTESRKKLEKYISQCKYALDLSTPYDSLVIVKRLNDDVNSIYADYSPRILNDTLLFFTSQRKTDKPVNILNIYNNENIYVSVKKDKQWQKAQKLGDDINKPNEQNSCIGINGNIFYIYRSVNKGDIYECVFNNKFSTPKPIKGEINSRFKETSVSFDNVNGICYFTSNRTDIKNYGGIDIFKATKDENGKWTNIENLGPNINSENDDNYVFYSEIDSSLYFSSNRSTSIGRYDIFKAKYNKGSFEKAINLGKQINTPRNDIFYIRVSKEKAYYSSDTKNTEEDIYEITYLPKPDKTKQDWHLIALHNIVRIDKYIKVKNINFPFDSYISDSNMKDINILSDYLKQHKNIKLSITGYTDVYGNEEYNRQLSEKRAEFIAKLLIDKGVNREQLNIYGKGKNDLIAKPSKDMNLWHISKYNRRVEFKISEQTSPYIVISPVDVPEENQTNYYKKTNNKKFAVMLFVSSKKEDKFKNIKNIVEGFSKEDNKYYYHTKYQTNIKKVENEYKSLKSIYKNCYIFSLN